MRTLQKSLRPRDAARFLGISLATFWRWQTVREDMPRGRKLSRGVTVFDVEELMKWRDSQPFVHRRRP